MTPIHKWAPDDKVLLLTVVTPEGRDAHGVRWPESGPVEAPLWSKRPVRSSGGLFGWPWGEGIDYAKWPVARPRWLVFSADPKDVVRIGAEVKVPRGEVIYSGDFAGAIEVLLPGLVAWYKSRDARRHKRKAKGSKTAVVPPVIATGRDELAVAETAARTLAISDVLAAGRASLARGEHGVAVGLPFASSIAATVGKHSVAAGFSVARSCGERSVAVVTDICGDALATGAASVACALQPVATVEGHEGSVCLLMGYYGYWVPQPNTVLVQRWRDADGWRMQTFDANDYLRHCGAPMLVYCGKLYVKSSGKLLRSIKRIRKTTKIRKVRSRK